jgi:hypothetical protein
MLGLRMLAAASVAVLVPFAPALGDGVSGKDSPPTANWSAGLMISTLGPGLQVSYHAYGWAVVRLEGTYVSVPFDGLTASLKSAGTILDLHPFQNAFRVSGGLRYFEYNIAGNAVVNNGGTPNTLQVAVTNTNKAAPYLGLGFDSSHFSGEKYELKVGLDIGAVYSGAPSVSLKNLTNPGEDIQTEINNYVSKYQFLNFYPVASVSVRLTF